MNKYLLPSFHIAAILCIIAFCVTFVAINDFVIPTIDNHYRAKYDKPVEQCPAPSVFTKYRAPGDTNADITSEAGQLHFGVTQEPPIYFNLTSGDYTDKKFKSSYVRTASYSHYRTLVVVNEPMGELLIKQHVGGSMLDLDDLRTTIQFVISRMPNIEYNENYVELTLETSYIETRAGGHSYDKSAKRNNFGLLQIRHDTAEDTLRWLRLIERGDVVEAVMQFYDEDKTLEENLLTNVPFSIAMAIQIYWRKVPDLYSNTRDLLSRAIIWKSAYNTYLGEGTIAAYQERYVELTPNAVFAKL